VTVGGNATAGSLSGDATTVVLVMPTSARARIVVSWSAVLLTGLVSVSSDVAVTVFSSVSPAAPGAVSYWNRTYSVLVCPLATTPG